MPSKTQKPNKALSVSDAEWAAAKKFFDNNPSMAKLRYKDDTAGILHHSFHRVVDERGKTLIIAKKELLGRGADGCFKAVAVDDAGDVSETHLGIKISDSPVDTELNILKKLGRLRALFTHKLKKILLMERYPGKTLDHYYSAPLSLRQRLDITYQIAISIKALHQQNIYHQDLHAGNMIVEECGDAGFRVHIIDFSRASATCTELTTRDVFSFTEIFECLLDVKLANRNIPLRGYIEILENARSVYTGSQPLNKASLSGKFQQCKETSDFITKYLSEPLADQIKQLRLEYNKNKAHVDVNEIPIFLVEALASNKEFLLTFLNNRTEGDARPVKTGLRDRSRKSNQILHSLLKNDKKQRLT